MSATKSKTIKTDAERAAQKAAFNPATEALIRVGYGVCGVIYFVMGLLALDVTLGKGGAPTSPQGAIAFIGSQPAGLALLWVILIGLISYSIWGVIRAVFDPLRKGNDAKGLFNRAGYLFSAAGYALLIFPTAGYISGSTSNDQIGAQSQQFMASIMSSPQGRWEVVIIGILIIAAGVRQIYSGFKSSFDKQFKAYAMTAQEVKWATQLGRFGTATRGVIFAMVGGLICQAGLQSNSSQAVGIDAALATLLHQPYGDWLLGIAGLGLMAFGVFSLLTGVWFRMKK